MWQAQQSITWPGGGRSAKYAQGWWIVPAPPPRFSQDENPSKKWFTAGFITYACHWLARGVAEWGDKTSWKECTCRSAQGFHKEETLTPNGVRVSKEGWIEVP